MARRDEVTTRTRIAVERRRGVFMISVAAELAQMHPQTLRMYEARGLIEPKRSPKGTRLYSHDDVERLRRIQEMTGDLGLNLAGVERVLALESQLEALNARIDEALPLGRGDERRLTQVLLNLVGNAIKFTDRGSVDVAAGVVEGRFQVAVRDTGPGIAEAHIRPS